MKYQRQEHYCCICGSRIIWGRYCIRHNREYHQEKYAKSARHQEALKKAAVRKKAAEERKKEREALKIERQKARIEKKLDKIKKAEEEVKKLRQKISEMQATEEE